MVPATEFENTLAEMAGIIMFCAIIYTLMIRPLFSKKVEYVCYEEHQESFDNDAMAFAAYEETGDAGAFAWFQSEPEEEVVVIPPPVIQPSPKPKKVRKPSAKQHHLYDDCIEALMSLGWSKRDAASIVANYLNKKEITSVENFILEQLGG